MTVLVLALVFMIAFTVLAFEALLWQSNDISVSIVSETEEGSNEVTISVLNTAGSTLLFYENSEITGKIEYLSDEGWVEYCDVCYTDGNVEAFSQQYGGTFAELEPGEDWTVSVPEDKVEDMQNGTYRIKMTYITEKQYNEYIDIAFKEDDESEESLDESTDEESKNDLMGSILRPITDRIDSDEESEVEEEFLASSECEVFIKTFEYTAPEDYVGEISINDSDIEKAEENVSEEELTVEQ